MTGRPEGTDGSDHSYRMVVEERYKIIAYNRTMCQRLLPLHALVIVLQSAWLASPVLIGYTVNAFVYAFVVAEVVAVLFWSLAKVGTQKEDTFLLKGFSTTLLVMTCAVWGTTAGYFMVTDVKLRVPSLMASTVAQHLGWAEDDALQALDSLEVLFRAVVLAVVSATAFFGHALVQVKMKLRKQEKLRTQANKSE